MGDVMRRDCLGKVSLIHVDRSTDDPSWFHWEEWCDEFGFELPKTKHQKLHFAYTTMALRSMYDGNGLHLAQLSLTVGDLLYQILLLLLLLQHIIMVQEIVEDESAAAATATAVVVVQT